MQELLDFLEENGIYPHLEGTKVVAFKDGFVLLSVGEEGTDRLVVELFDFDELIVFNESQLKNLLSSK